MILSVFACNCGWLGNDSSSCTEQGNHFQIDLKKLLRQLQNVCWNVRKTLKGDILQKSTQFSIKLAHNQLQNSDSCLKYQRLQVLANAVRQEKEIKGIHIGEEEKNTSFS